MLFGKVFLIHEKRRKAKPKSTIFKFHSSLNFPQQSNRTQSKKGTKMCASWSVFSCSNSQVDAGIVLCLLFTPKAPGACTASRARYYGAGNTSASLYNVQPTFLLVFALCKQCFWFRPALHARISDLSCLRFPAIAMSFLRFKSISINKYFYSEFQGKKK